MCLVFVAWQAHPGYRLVVAANRDEFHARPTAPAAVWTGRTGGRTNRGVLAGRDLEAGGTWLGVTADGRFAALTNFRAAASPQPGAPSRGRLAAGYLQGGLGARDYAHRVARDAGRYRGFSLLLADEDRFLCVSNRAEEPVVEVPAGCHGLSNDRLNVPWPKVTGGLTEFRRRLRGGFEKHGLFALLADDEPADEAELRPAGLDPRHSARFIRGAAYGTRSSTVAGIGRTGAVVFEERSFDARAAEIGRVAFETVANTGTGSAGFTPVPATRRPTPPSARTAAAD